MHLKVALLRGIVSFGIEKPSAIQQLAIVPCCAGKDLIAQQYQSGPDRIATFSIPVLQRVDENDPNVQALVLASTRELAQQVYYYNTY
jgi:superfamily II DNA/RNA helicase